MAITNLGRLIRVASPLTWDEGLRILERDRYKCQYCGLDGATASTGRAFAHGATRMMRVHCQPLLKWWRRISPIVQVG
jgi:hypothetical protein